MIIELIYNWLNTQSNLNFARCPKFMHLLLHVLFQWQNERWIYCCFHLSVNPKYGQDTCHVICWTLNWRFVTLKMKLCHRHDCGATSGRRSVVLKSDFSKFSEQKYISVTMKTCFQKDHLQMEWKWKLSFNPCIRFWRKISHGYSFVCFYLLILVQSLNKFFFPTKPKNPIFICLCLDFFFLNAHITSQ